MSLVAQAKLGTVVFHGWSGRLPPLQPEVDVFVRLGQAGSGAQVLGTRSPETQCKAWIGCTSAVEANLKAEAVEALQGTVVVLSDPFLRTMNRVRVRNASARVRTGRGSAVSGGTGMVALVACDFILERLTDSESA